MLEGKETHIFYMVIALIGGIAKQLHLYVTGKEFRWKMFLANCFISGFSGYIIAQTFIVFKPELAYVAGGIGGYMGVQAVDFIIIIFKKLTTKQITK